MSHRIAPPEDGPRFKRGKARKDRNFLAWLHSLPCIVTGSRTVEAAHIRYSAPRYGKVSTGMQEKPDDRWCIPLSPAEHRTSNDAQHTQNERSYWRVRRIDPCLVAALLYSAFAADDLDGANRVCAAAAAGSIPGEFRDDR